MSTSSIQPQTSNGHSVEGKTGLSPPPPPQRSDDVDYPGRITKPKVGPHTVRGVALDQVVCGQVLSREHTIFEAIWKPSRLKVADAVFEILQVLGTRERNMYYFVLRSSHIAEYGSTGQGCQSCSWSAEQGKLVFPRPRTCLRIRSH